MPLSRLKSVPALLLGALGGSIGSAAVLFRGGSKVDGGTIHERGGSEVFIIKTADRVYGLSRLLDQFDRSYYRGRRVALKANFNSADPFPASTHIDTLKVIVEWLRDAGADEIILAERSGMGRTRDVLRHLGVFDLAEKMGFKVLVLDEAGRDDWVKIKPQGTHWLRGFYIARIFLEADRVVQTCCLKTHRFGGHFTMSLKNSVGLVARQVPGENYDYMAELHTSPYQRLMIAEINKFYNVDLVVMDAMRAFATGGPEKGRVIEPSLLVAGKDRVAVDAVGVAILRIYGTTREVQGGRIFDLDQIRRASEIGVGVGSPLDIKINPLDGESTDVAKEIEAKLREGC
ncbi:MAG: DUF362 domain-containing protein [Candidatus Bathyarchaeia archaeon]